jgi:fatty-acyl-CoA synthase
VHPPRQLDIPPSASPGTDAAGAKGGPLLAVDDLVVTYDGAVRALHGVSVHVPHGGVVAVLGSNGAGKTTLLCGGELRAAQTRRATLLSAAPTLLDLLMTHPDLDTTDLTGLRVVFTGGSMLTPARVDTIEARFGAPLATTFGMTETCGSALLTAPLADSPDVRRTSAGRPLPGTEVRVVDLEGEVLRVGETGELLLRGARLADGYHDDPPATARAIGTDGWLHTGDLAEVDEQGGVRIAGRLKDMIKTGGENVTPDEVEDVIAEHPTITRAAVVGVPDQRWGELVTAFVVPAPGTTVDPERLAAHCRTRLSTFKVPRRWNVVDELPLTASSKVQRAELRRRAAAAEEVATGPV